MPKYFVDLQDGDVVHEDDEGSDLSSVEDARKEAINTLSLIAKDELPDGEHREFIAIVRDAGGTALYRATLTFHEERFGQMA